MLIGRIVRCEFEGYTAGLEDAEEPRNVGVL